MTELAKCRDLKGNALKEQEAADFYVLINWVVWLGKLNNDHAKVWEDQARNNKNCKIKVIKVNHDFQQYWGKEENKRIKEKLSKKK
jgi:hypothetical protein